MWIVLGPGFARDSSQQDGTMWLCSALLFLCLPGCLALTGPGYVKGIEGTTLHVHCRYDVGYKGYKKYWCRGEHDIGCKNIVGTKGGETVERNGHVSIRDHADDLTMTVTMEDLQEHDAGTYWCKIQTMWIWDELSRDVAEMVKVNVILATTPVVSTLLPTTHTFRQNVSIEVSTLYTRSPLTGLHLLLLVFLKLPVFLSILCAVFWVNRSQKAAGKRGSQPVQEPCGALPEECPVPGLALQTGPEEYLVLESLTRKQQWLGSGGASCSCASKEGPGP